MKKKNFNDLLEDFLVIKPSLIKGAGKGAFAKKKIKKGTRLGEYTGKILSLEEYSKTRDKTYIFEVSKKFQGKYYLFYIDARSGDQLKFINGAHSKEQKKHINVETYQYAERIFYRTTKNIKEGEELLVDYGDNYWE